MLLFLLSALAVAMLYRFHQFNILSPQSRQVLVLQEQPWAKPLRFIRSALWPCLTFYMMIFQLRDSPLSELRFGWQPPQMLNQSVSLLFLALLFLLPAGHLVWHLQGAFRARDQVDPTIRRFHLKLGLPCVIPIIVLLWAVIQLSQR